jgi:hypothetical protein
MANIIPVDKTITKTITRFTLDISELVINTLARFRVSQYDANDNLIDATNVTIEGEEYTNWRGDDTYVVNLISQKMGFIIQN